MSSKNLAEDVKTCRTCHKDKERTEFQWIATRQIFDSECKECKHKRQRKWWHDNRDKIAARRRAAYKADPEKMRRAACAHYRKDIEASRKRNREYHATHKETINRNAYARISVEVNRRSNLRRYGITPEHFDAVLEAQGGVCLICGKPETAKRKGRVRPLSVDHDHENGEIRGLLCSACNTALGMVDESVDVLARMIAYLTVEEE